MGLLFADRQTGNIFLMFRHFGVDGNLFQMLVWTHGIFTFPLFSVVSYLGLSVISLLLKKGVECDNM